MHKSSALQFFSLLLVVLVLTPALLGQQVGTSSCSMAGTWYGGSDIAKYMITITADPGGHFTMVGAGAFTQASLGFPVTTTFSNSIVKRGAGVWEFFGTGMVNKSAAFPAPNPELWAVHGTARLVDCNTLQLDYDFFGAYHMPTEKKPFLSEPDYVVVPAPFVERYQKVPNKCTVCGKK